MLLPSGASAWRRVADPEFPGGGMRRGPEYITFSATAGGIFVATSVALMLIIYALLTFVALLPPSAAQQLVGFTY